MGQSAFLGCTGDVWEVLAAFTTYTFSKQILDEYILWIFFQCKEKSNDFWNFVCIL